MELVRKIHGLLAKIMTVFEEKNTLEHTEGSIKIALTKIDTDESAFKDLINRYKLDKILMFYLSGEKLE